MSTRSKAWLQAAAIISLISCASLVALGICVIFNILGATQYVKQFIQMLARGVNSGDMLFFKVTLVVSMGLSFIINLIAAYTYFKVAGTYHPGQNEYISLCIVSSIQLILGSTILPGLIVLVIVMRNKHLYNTHPDVAKENQFDNLTREVGALNRLRNDGTIDVETYRKQLDRLLTKHINNNR